MVVVPNRRHALSHGNLPLVQGFLKLGCRTIHGHGHESVSYPYFMLRFIQGGFLLQRQVQEISTEEQLPHLKRVRQPEQKM